MKKIKFFNSDKLLLVALTVILLGHYTKITPLGLDDPLLTFFASIATLPVLLAAFHSLKNKKISVSLLASIALVFSLLNREWASAVFINLMLTSARIFADYTENRTSSAIKSLLKLRPEKVKVKKGEKITEEPVSKIKINDLVVIELGDRIPVDGVIVSGQAFVDQSSLTGESVPVSKGINNEVLSSTLNVSGSMTIRAKKVGKDTTFEKIIQLVEQSQKNKTGIQTTVDKFTSRYIIVTLLGSIILYLISHSLNLVLSVLLVTCADDIAVAVPMAFSAAIGNAAKQGIIIKGGAFLEGLTKAKTVLVDKTGTLTRGKLKVEDIVAFGDFAKDKVLKLAAISDFFSEHPFAKAVVRYAHQNKLAFEKPIEFEMFPGKGSTAVYKNKKIVCGKLSFLQELGVKTKDEQLKEIDLIKKEGLNSLLLVGYDRKLIGYITLADELRPEVKEAIEALKKLGIENIVMLTGDDEKVAKKIAREANISTFHANLLPEDKLKYIKENLSRDHKVVMIGDGVNDAAALALADIGIAMGTIGSDAAIEAADVALMKDDFSKIPEAVKLGVSVTKVARQDFWIWGVVNTIGLILVFSKIMGPEGAAAYNFITDFFPLLNSLRLFRIFS